MKILLADRLGSVLETVKVKQVWQVAKERLENWIRFLFNISCDFFQIYILLFFNNPKNGIFNKTVAINKYLTHVYARLFHVCLLSLVLGYNRLI